MTTEMFIGLYNIKYKLYILYIDRVLRYVFFKGGRSFLK